MTKPLSHVLVPPLAFDLFFSSGMSAMLYGYSKGEIYFSVGSFGFFMVIGLPVGIYLTQQLYMRVDPDVMTRTYELNAQKINMQKKRYEEPVELRVVHEKPGQTQVDYFRGISADVWREVAARVAVKGDFTTATVGQTRRPRFIEILEPRGYVRYVGGGQYELTREGIGLFQSLAARPPHLWDIPPKLLQNLG